MSGADAACGGWEAAPCARAPTGEASAADNVMRRTLRRRLAMRLSMTGYSQLRS
jgi:hypothetical protein